MQARTALSFARILNLPQPSSGGLLVAFDGLQACWRTLSSLAAATRPPLQVSGVWLGAERPQWIPSALQHARQFSREAMRSQGGCQGESGGPVLVPLRRHAQSAASTAFLFPEFLSPALLQRGRLRLRRRTRCGRACCASLPSS